MLFIYNYCLYQFDYLFLFGKSITLYAYWRGKVGEMDRCKGITAGIKLGTNLVPLIHINDEKFMRLPQVLAFC